jgi:hypothetical protein
MTKKVLVDDQERISLPKVPCRHLFPQTRSEPYRRKLRPPGPIPVRAGLSLQKAFQVNNREPFRFQPVPVTVIRDQCIGRDV